MSPDQLVTQLKKKSPPRIAIVSGSFDPITKGHEHLIETAAQLFDRVIVLLAVNPAKRGFFTTAERLELLLTYTTLEVGHLPNVQVSLLPDDDLVVNFAVERRVRYIVRGLRNSTDLEYENGINQLQRDIDPSIQTIFIPTPEHLVKVSSSMVKSIVGKQGWETIVSKYVSPSVVKLMKEKLNS